MLTARRRPSLVDTIYESLRRMIVTLELRPGEVLSEKELCARFAVSRTPVREALLRLSEQGLVVIAPQHATFVAAIDPDAVRQAHFLRENLEVPVTMRLCRMPGIDLAIPRGLVLEQQAALERGDVVAFFHLDDRFHGALFDLAGLGQLWGVIQARKAHLDRIRFLQTPQPGKIGVLVREHESILQAIARCDGAEAARVVRVHVSGALAHMEQLLVSAPSLFGGKEPLARRPLAAQRG